MNDYLLRLIKKIIFILNKIDSQLHQKRELDLDFEDLTPIDNLERDEYIEALEWAVNNNRINNIALTGTYGSGKSSILQSFQKQNSQISFLNISLASFTITDDNKATDDNKSEKADLNRLIERSILQQIFYTEDPSKIPESRFKRIHSIGKLKVAAITAFIVMWLSSSFLIFGSKSFKFLNIDFLTEWSNTQLSKYSVLILFLFGIVLLVYFVISNLKKLTFSKLNLTKGEIELAKNIDSSIFNKHLDEILYFFEVCNYNIVVFEDLDRFNSIDIFTKLRELNLILNESKQVNRRIKFIYSLRDDLFTDKNRTKFFDFIIPTIPVINSTNSEEILLNRLDSFISNDLLSREFIADISIYIEDMRLLKNTCNEFVLYEKKLGKVGLNHEKLLAITTYKNLFPKDFSLLQENQGIVYDLFNDQKWRLVNSIEETLKSLITGLEEELDLLEKEVLLTIEDLRMKFLGKFVMEHNSQDSRPIHMFRFGNSNTTFEQVLSDKFSLFQNEKRIICVGLNGSSFSSPINFSQIDEKPSYAERENRTRKIQDGKIEQLKSELEKNKRKILELKSKRLKGLIENREIDQVFDEKIELSRFVFFLIRNGYVDETYADYLTYFHEGSLTLSDKKFIFSIKDRSQLSFEHTLTNFSEITRRLRIQEFGQKEVLNIYLIAYLIENKDRFENELNKIFHLISNEDDYSIEFVEKIISIQNGIFPYNPFFNRLFSNWENVWAFVILKKYPKAKMDVYLSLILQYCSPQHIIEINNRSNGDLKSSISEDELFVEKFSDNGNLEMIQQNLLKLNVKISRVRGDVKLKALLEFLYLNNLYSINTAMLGLMLNFFNKCGDIDSEDISYGLIKNVASGELKKYVEENIDVFVTEILLKRNLIIEEEPDCIALLNSEEIDPENLTSMIELLETKINDLSEIKHVSIKSDLLLYSKVTPKWDNVLNYFSQVEELDDNLIQYFSEISNSKELSTTKIDIGDREELVESMCKSILLSENIDNDIYDFLLKSIPYNYLNLKFENLSEEKIIMLLGNGILSLTEDNYDELRDKFPPHHISIAENFADSFVKNLEKWNVDDEDINSLLESDKFANFQKLEVFNYHIKDVDSITPKIAISSVKFLVLIPSSIEFSIMYGLFKKSYGVTEERLKIIVENFIIYSKTELMNLISVLPRPYSDISKNGCRPKIDDTEINRILINKLSEAGMISSFKESSGGKIRINTKRK